MEEIEYDSVAKLRQQPGSMDYQQFVKAVALAWGRSHPDIPIMCLGAKNFDNAKPIITYHLQRREPLSMTPKSRQTEDIKLRLRRMDLNQQEIAEEKSVVTSRMEYENTILFTIHVPAEQGGGEVAEAIVGEFERFMQEHVELFMRLGAKQLRHLRTFYDQSILNDGASNIIRRFVAYTLNTQIVTQVERPVLQKLEAEIRAVLVAGNGEPAEVTSHAISISE